MKINKGFTFLVGVVDIYSKYAWFSLLKDKEITSTNAFQKIVDESNHKPSMGR